MLTWKKINWYNSFSFLLWLHDLLAVSRITSYFRSLSFFDDVAFYSLTLQNVKENWNHLGLFYWFWQLSKVLSLPLSIFHSLEATGGIPEQKNNRTQATENLSQKKVAISTMIAARMQRESSVMIQRSSLQNKKYCIKASSYLCIQFYVSKGYILIR